MTTLTRPLGMTQTRQLLTFPNNGYAPTVTAYLWGAGGGSGGSDGGRQGGNATGGGYVKAQFTAVPGDTIEVTVGAAGWSGRASSSSSNTATPVFSTRTAIPDGATAVLPVASSTYIAKWSSFLNHYGVWNTGASTNLSQTLTFDQTYSVQFPFSVDYYFTLAAYYQATVYLDGVELFSSGLNSWITQETVGVPWIANIIAGLHTIRIVATTAPNSQYGTWGVGLTIDSTASAGQGGGALTRTIFDTRSTPATPPLTIPDVNPLIASGKTGSYSNLMNDYGMWESDPTASTCSRTYSIYFPYTGVYTVQMCAANTATLSIDGTAVYTTPGSTSYTTAYTTEYTVSQGYHTILFTAALTDPTIIGGVAIVISKSWSGATGGQAGPIGSSGGGGGSGGATTLVLNPGTTNETLLAVAVGGAGGGGAGNSDTGRSEATAPGPRGQTAAGISNGQVGQSQTSSYPTAQVVGIPPIPASTGYYTRTANPSSNPYGAREYWVVINGAVVYNSSSAPSQYQPGAYQGSAIGVSPSYPGGQDNINAFNYSGGYADGGGGGAGGPGGPDGAGLNGYSSVGDSYAQAGTVGISYRNTSATIDGSVVDPVGTNSAGSNSPYYSVVPNAGAGASAGQLRGQHGAAVVVFDAYGIQVRDDAVDGSWHDVKTAFVNVDGTWKQTTAIYIYQNNVWNMLIGGAALAFTGATTDYGLLSRPSDNRAVPAPPPPVVYDSEPRRYGGYNASTNSGSTAGCFVEGTKITMADGSIKSIEDIAIGEQLIGKDGVVNTVLEYLRPVLGNRTLIAFNGGVPFITDDHPVLMKDGTWKSVDPTATLSKYVKLTDRNIGQLTIGDTIATPDGAGFEIVTIERHQEHKDLQLYNFSLDGNNTYVANDLVVHNKCFIAGTEVLMQNGTWKNIEDVQIDEVLIGKDGRKNQILRLHRPTLGINDHWLPHKQRMVSINNSEFATSEDHMFFTTVGWKAPDAESCNLVHKHTIAAEGFTVTQLQIGDHIVKDDGNTVEVTSIDFQEDDPDTQLYNFWTNGNHTYHVRMAGHEHGMLVHNKCFIAGTKVLMRDGTWKNIEDVELGESLIGENNTVNLVKEFHRPTLGINDHWLPRKQRMVSINGSEFATSEDHMFKTVDGWKAPDAESCNLIHKDVIQLEQMTVTQLNVGDKIINAEGSAYEVHSIEFREDDPELQLYNFNLSSNRTYHVKLKGSDESYLVHNKGCFTGNTLVTMADGSTKQICNVQIGDLVYNHNQTKINRVVFVEKQIDNSFGFLYSPDQQHKPFATANHPLYINGKLSSLAPEKIYNSYPWLGKTELIETTNISPADGSTVYNLWTDGDHTFTVNGYGTTTIVADGGVLRLMTEQGLISSDRASGLLISFDGLGKHTVYGLYALSRVLGKADIKLVNKLTAWVFADDSKPVAQKMFYNIARAVGGAICLIKRR